MSHVGWQKRCQFRAGGNDAGCDSGSGLRQAEIASYTLLALHLKNKLSAPSHRFAFRMTQQQLAVDNVSEIFRVVKISYPPSFLAL